MTILVAGAGGFIGGHLVQSLLHDGFTVRAVDVKPFAEWHQLHHSVENVQLDLSDRKNCVRAMRNIETVYQLAADMGGIGFIESHKTECMLSVLTNTHMLLAARNADVSRFFYSSSACVYPANMQAYADVIELHESDAYPADPEDGYGWEKLFSERMCRHFREDYGLQTRVARYHNIYGPYGTWDGGREKAPAALCRKVAVAKLTDANHIAIWGDGRQTRSFTYVSDCVEGTRRLLSTDVDPGPVNVGSNELVTINGLAAAVLEIAGVQNIGIRHVSGPQGVRGRNSDNTYVQSVLGWEPSVSLFSGLTKTYAWVEDQVRASLKL